MDLGYYYINFIVKDSVKEVLYVLRYYSIYFIIEDSVKEVLYGPEVLQHIIEDSVQKAL